MPSLVELKSIFKRFGRVEALRGVDFTLEAGEVHALLGENGAGKSTLMRVAYGLIQPDAGTISVRGAPQRFRGPIDARRQGIGMVHQHFTSIPRLTVLENITLTAGWAHRPGPMRERVRDLGQSTGLTLDPDAPVEELSAGLKQRLEVLKALAGEARVLLLDEPSSVLSPVEASALFDVVSRFREQGISTVLITHKMGEALAIADRVTVLRRGAVVHTGRAAAETAESLAMHMLGEAPPPRGARAAARPGAERVHVRDLMLPRLAGSGTGLFEATFSAHAGEVLGVAAVEGNGQRELLRAIAGVARPTKGSLTVTPPVSFIPEDRTGEGLVADFSLCENLVLNQGASAPWIRGPWVDWRRAAQRVEELISGYRLTTTGPDAPARSLSGGNQQRLLIASALERQPTVLVAENPTRGLDLRATAEVLDRLREAARNGVAVIVHLADLDELLELVDRVLVVASGVVSEVPRGATRDQIGRRMLGEHLA
jgi:simple sugar transport system ATP-binding protein